MDKYRIEDSWLGNCKKDIRIETEYEPAVLQYTGTKM